MESLLVINRFTDRLVTAWFAERNPFLARRVEVRWDRHARAEHRTAFRHIARDVWDLVRDRCDALIRLAAALPRGTLTVTIAGSPCQQLIRYNIDKGILGMTEVDSRHFFAVPIIAGALQRVGFLVHVFLENAVNMRPEFREAICRALGIPDSADYVARRDAARY